MIRLLEIKDIIAKERGYKDWKRAVSECTIEQLMDMYDDGICKRYAEEVAEKSIQNALEDEAIGMNDVDVYIELL